jgi:hypothetical protein
MAFIVKINEQNPQISSPFVTGMHENGDYIAISTSSCITNADLIDPRLQMRAIVDKTKGHSIQTCPFLLTKYKPVMNQEFFLSVGCLTDRNFYMLLIMRNYSSRNTRCSTYQTININGINFSAFKSSRTQNIVC